MDRGGEGAVGGMPQLLSGSVVVGNSRLSEGPAFIAVNSGSGGHFASSGGLVSMGIPRGIGG